MQIVRRLLLLAPTALLLTACTSTEPNGMHRVSVSAATSAGSARAAAGIVADLVVGGEEGSVTISSAQIVLSRLKLANNESCADSDDVDDVHDGSAAVSSDDDPDDDGHDENGEDDDEGCPPLKVGPVLVDLPLDGTTTVVLDALVPAGTYTRLQARLHAVAPHDEGATDFLTAHPDFEGISVKVVGVFKDADGVNHDFTFTSPMNVVTAVNFDTPITVGEGTTNLTIDVDVSSWFTDATGAVIDPTNSVNQHAIEKNIRTSLRAFEDDDHDGADDHEELDGHP